MYSTLKNFPEQFKYNPVIENSGRLRSTQKFIVVGMGGSHLAADLVKEWNPYLEVLIHKDYGLPKVIDKTLRESLIILSSYSGDTEEVLDAFAQAIAQDLNVCAISVGGKLLEMAKKESLPFIQLPDTGIPPRLALGFSTKAHIKLMGNSWDLEELTALAGSLDGERCESQGKDIAQKINGKTPIIYASSQNYSVAYNWKTKFNETGKIPAFMNVFPELNHNEINGFERLSQNFHFIFLEDANDDPRIQKRMGLTKKNYENLGLGVEVIKMSDSKIWRKIFISLLTADWTAYYTAKLNGADPERVPVVEEFKTSFKEA